MYVDPARGFALANLHWLGSSGASIRVGYGTHPEHNHSDY
jgi:hypothetical protein